MHLDEYKTFMQNQNSSLSCFLLKTHQILLVMYQSYLEGGGLFVRYNHSFNQNWAFPFSWSQSQTKYQIDFKTLNKKCFLD